MKIKSAIITQASGSVGGLTASRNRGGLYLRARAIPVNPSSAFQVAVRNALATLVNRWTTILTTVQRDAWTLYANNVPVMNNLGDFINLTGQQHYIRSNTPRIQAGLTVVDAGPVIFNTGSVNQPSLLYDSALQQIGVNFDDTESWVNEDGAALLAYTSRGQNESINFFKGPYRLAGSILGNSLTPPTSAAVIDPPPFVITALRKYFDFVRLSSADGRLSGKIEAGALAS